MIDKLLKDAPPCISAITEIELLCSRTTSQKDTDLLNSFIDDSIVIELEKSIKISTAEIRKQTKIKLPDAIIAATAVVYGYTLLTRNVSDFSKVDTLKVINPWGTD